MSINSVIVGRWGTAGAVAARSLREPETVFVSIKTRGIAGRNGLVVTARPAVIRIFLWLCCANGRHISMPDLVDLIYGADEDGGPDGANAIVRAAIAEAKVVAAALGVVIAASGNRGYTARIAGTAV